jgi:hypothetical protein
MVTAKPVGNNFCGAWRTGARCCSTARGYEQVGALLAPRADSVANWSISTGWRDRMEKLLLTVWGPQTCSVSVRRECMSCSTLSSSIR